MEPGQDSGNGARAAHICWMVMAEPGTPRRDGPLRMYLSEQSPACPRCGYSLRGCVTEICPECGTPLALTLAPARADRRIMVLLLLMLGWALAASGTETYHAQSRARTEAQGGGWRPVGIATRGSNVWWSGNMQVTIGTAASAGGAGGSGRLIARQVAVRSPLAGTTYVWSAVTWQTWIRLGAWSVLVVLGALGLIGVARYRVRAAWPRGFVRSAAGVFIACAVLSVAFRLPIL